VIASTPLPSEVLRLTGIRKSFSGIGVLRGIDVSVHRGTIHALVGENGAGKSTLARIVAGAIPADEGEIELSGERLELTSPRAARRLGISIVSQELALVPAMSVIENVFAGQVPTWGPGLVSRRKMRVAFRRLLDDSGITLDPDRAVSELGIAQQSFVEILRAMVTPLKVLILDEPTAAMGPDQSAAVLALARRVAAAGTAVVLISHTLEDVLAVSDVISVLRDGMLVRTAPASELSRASLIEHMTGRPLGEQFPAKPLRRPGAEVVLRARDVHTAGAVSGVDLDVYAGEIVGIAGLVGSGRTEFVRCLVGADRRQAGTIAVAGQAIPMRNVIEARAHGIVMIPEDRKRQGLHLDHTVEANLALPHLAHLSRCGIMRPGAATSHARVAIDAVKVDPRALKLPVRALSGGNQQRVLFAKWLASRPRVVIADEPTRGVDVAGKRAIYDLLVEIAERGTAIILVSSELTEVIAMSHRVVVMRRGTVAAELEGAQITEQQILHAAFDGHSPLAEVGA
jgi:rhamnose transport system ATP-binding protein